MGFFSSRRPEHEKYVSEEKPAAVNVVRSRFYGKNKQRPREIPQTAHTMPRAQQPHPPSPFSSSPPSRPRPHPPLPSSRVSTDVLTVMLAQRLNELATANAEGLLDDDEYRLLRQSLFERLSANAPLPTETPVVPIAGPSRVDAHSQTHTSSTQRTTPSRPPSIQSKRSISSNLSSMLRRATSRRSSSTSRDRDPSDTNSMFSVGSMSSGLIQRRLFTRPLHKQTSELSLRTDSSPFDSASISSHVKSARGGIATEPTTPSSPSLSRTTTRSARRLPKAAPPSSFHGRVVGLDPPNGRSSGLDITTDSEQLKTARDIRHEIESVEAEGRRLLDAFNGLELSTLTRRQHRPSPLTPNASSSHLAVPGTHPSDLQDPLDSSWTLIPDRRSRFRKDSDSTSVRSSGSNGTSLSDYRLPTRSRPKGGSPLVAQPVSLGRKSSFASVSSLSRGRSASTSVPALPSSSTSVIGRLGSASSSSLNLSRSASHLPLATVAEGDGRESVDGHRAWPGLPTPAGHAKSASVTPRSATSAAGDDAELAALEVEMADIRRRRTEVVGRYEERLEYLRAKLKGAELHEKLLRQ